MLSQIEYASRVGETLIQVEDCATGAQGAAKNIETLSLRSPTGLRSPQSNDSADKNQVVV